MHSSFIGILYFHIIFIYLYTYNKVQEKAVNNAPMKDNKGSRIDGSSVRPSKGDMLASRISLIHVTYKYIQRKYSFQKSVSLNRVSSSLWDFNSAYLDTNFLSCWTLTGFSKTSSKTLASFASL